MTCLGASVLLEFQALGVALGLIEVGLCNSSLVLYSQLKLGVVSGGEVIQINGKFIGGHARSYIYQKRNEDWDSRTSLRSIWLC